MVFVWQHFSIFELFITLLAPWRRDVAASSWRGFHPLKSLELLFNNILTRLIGAVVRALVIIFGLGVFTLTVALGLFLVFLWISAPLALAVLALYAFNGTLKLGVTAGISLVWLAAILRCYFLDTKIPVLELDIQKLLQHPVFAR